MVKRLLFTFFLFISSYTFASHIVGGEFELIHISGNTYRLNVIIYFDVVNGNPAALDQQVTARIFRKSDHASMMLLTIPLVGQERVEYFQPDCSRGEVVTDRILYTTTIVLDENTYNDQEGYYVAWERCCRNYSIDNIKSVDVTANPGTTDYAGQTFYLEFPAVVDEYGDPFINSSPQLFPPLNDYACPYRPYWVDFAGTDTDGDSLVYSLVTPLNTWDAVAVVQDNLGNQLGANPGPYPEVQWEVGYGLDNILGGDPDLAISDDGFLTVTPKNEGLFVFAVLCEEFRDGEKIGEVRRDFQMLVVDKCPVADPPKIRGKKLSDIGFTDAESMEVHFSNTVSDANRCIQVNVSDLDASKQVDDFREEVFIKAVPLNFKEDVGVVLPDAFQATLQNGSSATFDICFPECPFIDPNESDYFELAIVAFDDACALPLTDSLYVKVFIEPPVNNPPVLRVDNNANDKYVKVVQQTAGGKLILDVESIDVDGDVLIMEEPVPVEFDLTEAGMSFSLVEDVPGHVQYLFEWNLDCNDDIVNYDVGRDTVVSGYVARVFEILLFVEDEDDCDFERMDEMLMQLIIQFPGETAPTIYGNRNGKNSYDSMRIEEFFYETIELDVVGEDQDKDQVKITAEGANFNFSNFDISFSDKQGGGDPGITSPFSWYLNCDHFNLAEQDSFRVYFYIEDFDACELTNQDTLLVDFIIKEHSNTKPEIEFKNLNNELRLIDGNQLTANYLQNIEVEITGRDFNSDSVYLNLLGIRGAKTVNNHEFEPSKGVSVTRSTLFWDLGCEFLGDNFEPGLYDFVFTVTDDHCPQFDADTVTLHIAVEDFDIGEIKFSPPNVFTPNKDKEHRNEFFAVEGVDELSKMVIETGLPADNCQGQFQEIVIVNRWGREVFSSEVRDFKWYGEGEAVGVYFYKIIYTDKEFKGSITLLR